MLALSEKSSSTSFSIFVMQTGGSRSFAATAVKWSLLLVVVTTLAASSSHGFLIPHRKSVAADDVEDRSADADSLRNIAYNDAAPSIGVQCGSPSTLSLPDTSDASSSPNWPWAVSIRADNSHVCGGTLIGNRWVLTAAVCAKRLESADDKVVVVGRRGPSESDELSQTVPIEAVIVDDRNAGDVALLMLADLVSFNSASLPVCLPQSFQTIPTGKICWTTGWTDNGLTQNLVTKVDSEMCEFHPHQHHHQQQQQQNSPRRGDEICTLAAEGETPCQIESPGSPMVCLEGTRWVLFGVGGTDDVCSEEVAGTRTFQSVSANVDWISRQIHGH